MENQRKKKSSRGEIAEGVFIALYLVTYFIIGAICMTVSFLFHIMPAGVALFAATTYHILLINSARLVQHSIAQLLPILHPLSTLPCHI